MIIEADIVRHPKFIKLKTLVGDIALEHLARLWAHCQQGKRGQTWTGADALYVEVVITGSSQRGKLFTALRDCDWLHERPDGIEIHEWDKYNASLVARWNRPKQTPAHKAAQPPAQPPAQTPAPVREGSGGDTSGQDRRGNTPRLTPTRVEAVAYFQKNDSGYAKADIEAVFTSFEATKMTTEHGYAWRWGNGTVTDWRNAMASRLLDRVKKNSARGAEKTDGEPPKPAGTTVAKLERA